ncbi:MAG: hypothetical protein ABJD97_17470, partial [Betaproteobacteria bacterium]
MRLAIPSLRRAAPGLAACALLLTGCGTVSTIAIGEDARAQIHLVGVNPVVKLPAEMTYMGPGQSAALMLGGPLVGAVIANNAATSPKAQLASEMQSS